MGCLAIGLFLGAVVFLTGGDTDAEEAVAEPTPEPLTGLERLLVVARTGIGGTPEAGLMRS